jgi:hypothetical protein
VLITTKTTSIQTKLYQIVLKRCAKKCEIWGEILKNMKNLFTLFILFPVTDSTRLYLKRIENEDNGIIMPEDPEPVFGNE